MNEENGINYYAVIPAIVRYDKKLKPAEKLLYGEITALSNKNGYCYAQNRYFANLYLVSIETVSRWLAHLQRLGYIKIIIQRDDNKKIIARHIYIIDKHYSEKKENPIDEKINTPFDKKLNTLLTENSIPIDEKVKENNINNNNTSNNKNIDYLFYCIINKSSKISNDFHEVVERLEFNYTGKMLFMLNEENLQMIKNIIYVLYELHNSKFCFLLSMVSRESLFNLYRTAQEHNPKDLLSYYKKTIINKMIVVEKEQLNDR